MSASEADETNLVYIASSRTSRATQSPVSKPLICRHLTAEVGVWWPVGVGLALALGYFWALLPPRQGSGERWAKH